MFAPSIGVAEDIANANSTACLAAHLARRGITSISVDMGDALGSPSTITASARRPGGSGYPCRRHGNGHATFPPALALRREPQSLGRVPRDDGPPGDDGAALRPVRRLSRG
jgi:Phenazine biosynthesis-like protein